jgi:tRNA nucleotidyltransferase (CCA-adding enzyme)
MKVIEDADLIRRPDRLADFLHACEADYRGRKGLENRPYPQADRLRSALKNALAIRARNIDTEGLDGVRIGEKLRAARIAAIADGADPAS